MQTEINVGDGELGLAIIGAVLQLRICQREALVRLAGIGELKRVHQLNGAVIGAQLRNLGCGGDGFLPLVRFAIGIDLTLVATDDVVPAERDHLLVGINGLGGPVCLTVDHTEAIEENGAIRLFGIGIGGFLGGCEDLFQDRDGLVILAQRVIKYGLVESEFEVICTSVAELNLVQGCERLRIMALTALNFRDLDLGFDVGGIGGGDALVNRQRLSQLIIG